MYFNLLVSISVPRLSENKINMEASKFSYVEGVWTRNFTTQKGVGYETLTHLTI